jgi:L-fuculose-phosphate aldolase
MNVKEQKIADTIAGFMRRLYERGLTTTSGGNISAKLDQVVLMTPGSTDKAVMQGCDIGRMSLDGDLLDPGFKPTCEAGMHLAIYRARPDVLAVVHAHPVTASAFAAAACPISSTLLAESYVVLGDIAKVPYHLQGGTALAEAVALAAKRHNCMLMQNHGALALGKNLLHAFDRLEVLENAAKTTLICDHLLKAAVAHLTGAQIEELHCHK